jgi:hypothetical protein
MGWSLWSGWFASVVHLRDVHCLALSAKAALRRSQDLLPRERGHSTGDSQTSIRRAAICQTLLGGEVDHRSNMREKASGNLIRYSVRGEPAYYR